ncbi:hypothetical protein LNQ52_25670 [Klebsiella pneumoniae subsp. pneumoniae]|nr:hypothetical protein [Klebsiella pneumoniae subsp. pneumoniae]
MNALRLMSVLALLLILLPWRAQAAEADDFVAASRSQQAQLLTPVGGSAAGGSSAAAAGVDHREPGDGRRKTCFPHPTGRITAIGRCCRAAGRNPAGPSRPTGCAIWLPARAGQPPYFSDNVTERASAARTLQREATPAMAALLQQWLLAETDDNVRGLLEVALARLQLAQPEASARLAAVTLLGHSADPGNQALLIPLPMPSMSRMRRCARRPAIACKRSNIVCCSAICWARPLWGCRWDRCCCWPRWGWRSPMACWG